MAVWVFVLRMCLLVVYQECFSKYTQLDLMFGRNQAGVIAEVQYELPDCFNISAFGSLFFTETFFTSINISFSLLLHLCNLWIIR